MKELVPLRDRCRGRWPSILRALGVPSRLLDTRHNGPCPRCGGKDRFRFTDWHQDGAWICSQCGRGGGADLVMMLSGLNFAEAAKRIEAVLGVSTIEPPRRSPAALTRAQQKVWGMSHAITPTSPAGLYLTHRGLLLPSYPPVLRWVDSLYHPQGRYPALIAQVCDAGGKPVNIHRTWLTAEGEKAPVDPVRKMMQGDVPPGAAIRLEAPSAELGVGEGIETCLHAGTIFSVPVWSCIDAGRLVTFYPPQGVERLWIFGDNDLNYVGQDAAFAAAKAIQARASHEGRDLDIRVKIPAQAGADWANVGAGNEGTS